MFNSTETYQTRSRRSSPSDTEELGVSTLAIDLAIAEKKILQELGPKACVMEEPCRIHAARKAKTGAQPEWADILK